jgi:hypothetical protein
MSKNKAPLFKWSWRLCSPAQDKWKEIVCKKYSTVFDNSLPILSAILSSIWNSLGYKTRRGNYYIHAKLYQLCNWEWEECFILE